VPAARQAEDKMVPTEYFLVVSAVLFGLGALGVIVRRNPLVMFMSIELMLNAANLAFIAFAFKLQSMVGQIFTFFVITVAAAEVTVGLGIIMAIFRMREDVDVDQMNQLHG
jgi:NADH-quinone oxidoreductase subunit K